MIYEVQTNRACDGFVSMWSVGGNPLTFETKGEADEALRLYLGDDKWLDPNSYRVAEVM